MDKNTAISAKANGIIKKCIFKGPEHKDFFLSYLPECRYQDAYHMADVMAVSEPYANKGTNKYYKCTWKLRKIREN